MIVGIDLGTTNSAVAYIDDNGNPQIITNRDGERTTPSVILFEGNNPIVGTTAKVNSVSDPLNAVQFVKRQIGNANFKFINEDGEKFSTEELSAIILKKLKEDAEERLGEKVDKAVITVPAYFDDSQRKATQDAGAIAGLKVLKVINEPTAAALAYGITKKCDKQNIMVYDLGGGTFDVTIMSLEQGEIKIKATGGDRNLGGFDFDNAIIDFVVNEFEEKFNLDLYDDDIALQELREKTEVCKKTLSNRSKALINISSQGHALKVEITNEMFETMISSLIDRTIFIMNSVIEDSGLECNQIDKILLVGGSTRIKKVQETIENVTGKKPSQEVNPDEVVAIGAALQAFIINDDNIAENEQLTKTKIVDVNSHSLGVIASDIETGLDFNKIILPRNTPIPAEYWQEFSTQCDNQEYLILRVTEGEDDDPEYVKIIGTSKLFLKSRPANSPVKIILSYDENSVVHVRVIDLVDNQDLGEMEIQRKSNLTSEEVLDKTNKISNLIIE